MRSFFLLPAVLVLLAGDAFSDVITGSVSDPSGRPVSRAIISLFARDHVEPRRVLTDTGGRFRFTDLHRGEYVLQAQAPGFSRYTSHLVTVYGASSTLTLDISLTLASQYQEIVVTAAASPQTVDEVSRSITVIDRESIDQRNEFFIPETLRITPGLRVQQLGGPGSFTTIKTRADCGTRTRRS